MVILYPNSDEFSIIKGSISIFFAGIKTIPLILLYTNLPEYPLKLYMKTSASESLSPCDAFVKYSIAKGLRVFDICDSGK